MDIYCKFQFKSNNTSFAVSRNLFGPSVSFCVLCIHSHQCRFVWLFEHYHSPKISHFFKESWFLLLKNGIKNQELGTSYVHCYLGVISFRLFLHGKQRNIWSYTNPHIHTFLWKISVCYHMRPRYTKYSFMLKPVTLVSYHMVDSNFSLCISVNSHSNTEKPDSHHSTTHLLKDSIPVNLDSGMSLYLCMKTFTD